MLASTPSAVMTAATCTSLWVSTPRMTSLAVLSSGSPDTSWGMLDMQGITVDHVSVYRWVQRFTPLLIDAARPCRHAPGDRWFVDETYLKCLGDGSICIG